jgi:hypothetical protein
VGADKKLDEYPTVEDDVLDLLKTVSKAKRTANMVRVSLSLSLCVSLILGAGAGGKRV